MKPKKLPSFLVVIALGMANLVSAQLVIDNATFFVEAGATVTVQGDLTSNANIQGPGKILLKGTANQNINMGGFTIPNLEMDNTSNVTLTGNLKIGTTLMFTNGKILAGANNIILEDVATVAGQGTGKFVETNGTGQLIKTLTANVLNFEMPLGTGTNYQPAFISSTGTYATASVAAQVKSGAHPNKHPRSTDYLNIYWPITQTGVTGTVRASGKYFSNFTGVEADLRGIVYKDGNWNLSNANINTTTDTAGALIAAGGADLYAMNRFILLKNKVFLQGAYNTTTGVMNDNLRTLASFPTSDPYRSAPYNAYFTHTNNTDPELIIAPATVLGAQALTDNNIVDWVFLELRNSTVSPGNAVVQTRSALLQRDGDVVDIDGVSSIYFKNIDASNFTIAVRHRNHLGLSTDPAVLLSSLSERIPASALDLTTATDAQLYGVANTNFASVSGKNLLYAGNVSGNGIVRYQGTNGPGALNVSDRVSLLTDLGNSELATSTTYQRGDVTLNGITRYQGTNGPGTFNVSDRVFILSTVLTNTELATKIQSLPN